MPRWLPSWIARSLRPLRRALGMLRDASYRITFLVVERLTPVRDDVWCFCTWPNYGHTLDNPRGVFEVVRHDAGIQKVVLLRTPLPPTTQEPTSVRFVHAESWRGAYHLARARVVLLGYGMTAITSYSRHLSAPRHLVIRLGHGIILRQVGRFDKSGHPWEAETRHYAATICSSESDCRCQQQAYAPVPRAWLVGQPRNDTILAPDAALPTDFREHLDSFDRRVSGRRVVLYAPTWRLDPKRIHRFSAPEVRALTGVLERHGAVLAIHGHPNADWKALFREIPASPAVISVRDLPEINVLLRRVDVLITDYSSVYLDFVMLDRPIIHFAYDLQEYKAQRGFFYEPEDAFAGTCAQTFEDLLEALDVALTHPEFERERRERVRAQFHSHGPNSGAAVARHVRDLVVEMRARR